MNENELKQKIREELTYLLGGCNSVYEDVNHIMKLVRDLRNTSWSAGRKFGEEHVCD